MSSGIKCQNCGSDVAFNNSKSNGLVIETSGQNLLDSANKMLKLSVERSSPLSSQLLEGEIARLDDLIAKLSQQRTALKTRLNSISPTGRLPPEIISEMFYWACRPTSNSDEGAQLPNNLTPLFIGKISRAWRDIAWSSPRLWSFISLRLSTRRYEVQSILLQEWLPRAGSVPLSIKLSHRRRDVNRWRINPPSAVFESLISYSYQWYAVDIFLPHRFDVFEKARGNLPRLTYLSIRSSVTQNIVNGGRAVDIFNISPRLTTVRFYGCTPSAFHLPWNQLSLFLSERANRDECLAVLQRSPRLIKCQFTQVYYGVEWVAPVYTLTMSELQSLDITPGGIEIINAISSPSLNDITLSSWATHLFSPVISLLQRCSCILHRICITDLVLNEGLLIELLSHMPSLAVLELNCSAGELSDTFFKALDPPLGTEEDSTNPAILPNLQKLYYEGYAVFTMQAFAEALTNRWRSVDWMSEVTVGTGITQLKSVKIKSFSEGFAADIGAKEKQMIGRLSEQGLEISITEKAKTII